jgi:phosphoadenosine phosphosulfate reductase
MLITSKRHTGEDLERWRTLERMDAINAVRLARSDKIEESLRAIEAFVGAGRCYAGTSWGKDSVTMVHLCARLRAEAGIDIPVVWVRPSIVANPDCVLVRDEFLARHAITYDEIDVEISSIHQDHDEWFEIGLSIARARHGARHISGIRASESKTRQKRMERWGLSSPNTCAPLGRWEHDDVFAYLHAHDLPVHPAYACSMNGTLDRASIRVASLGGKRGTGWGRAEWELRYYPEFRRAEVSEEGRGT